MCHAIVTILRDHQIVLEAERLEVPQNVAGATYHTLRQALAMGLHDGDLSEIIRVIERAADFELPKTRD